MSHYFDKISPDKKLAGFTTSTHTYKIIEEHPILVDVSIPKAHLLSQDNARKKVPICVEFHGGGLVS